MSDVLVPFDKLPIDLKLNEIHRKLELFMSREAELEALVAANTASNEKLVNEVAELRVAGNAAMDRLRAQIAAQADVITAQGAEIALAREGAVSAEKMAEAQAATDAAVERANNAATVADETEAEWDAVGQSPAEPTV